MKKQLLIISAIIIGSITLLSLTSIMLLQDPWVVPAKYEKMENPQLKNADADQIGRLLYTKHCKSCHGTKGNGDGTKAANVETKVPDFNTNAFKNETDGSLYYKTFIGRDDMPGFEKKITNMEDRWLIINYIRTLSK
jgi:mono/diheme cytochrome c family protein